MKNIIFRMVNSSHQWKLGASLFSLFVNSALAFGIPIATQKINCDNLLNGPLRGRVIPIMGVSGRKLVILGGKAWGGGRWGNLSDGAVLDMTSGTWENIPNPPEQLIDAFGAVNGNKVFVVSKSDDYTKNWARFFDLTSRKWLEVELPEDMKYVSRFKTHSITSVGESFFINGLRGRQNYWRLYTPGTATWGKFNSIPYGFEPSATIADTDGNVFIFAGSGIHNFDTLVNTTSGLSQSFFAGNTNSIHSFSGAVVGRKIVVWGGRTFSNGGRDRTWLTDFGKLIDLNSFTENPSGSANYESVNLPASPFMLREHHSAVAIDDWVLFFGGNTKGRYDQLNDFAVFDSSTKQWVCIPE